jgi:hypothetical protein
MLITVKNRKLVLGHTVYVRGDTFECRDAEAKLIVAGGMATKASSGAKATKASPKAPTTGVSKRPGSPPASTETMAQRVGRGGRVVADTVDPVPEPVVKPTTDKPLATPKPIGATTTQSQGTGTSESVHVKTTSKA